MKLQKKILIVVVVVLLSVFSIIYYAENIAVERFIVRRETLSSEKIPVSLDNTKIVFFSDIYYGSFMDEERLTNLVTTIQNTDPDIVIFGGDLYDPTYQPNEESNQLMIDLLASIDAPFGKFFVYGDNDARSEDLQNTITSLMSQANFELLNNTSIPIHRDSSKAITLVGLDNPITGIVDVDSAYSSVSNNQFVLSVCHTPDVSDQVPSDLTDYFIAGHSLGGQIYYYFDAYYQPAYAQNYLRGQYTVNHTFTLDVTSGTGTQGQDIRFLSNAEVVVYKLEHLDSNQENEVVQTPSTEIESPQNDNTNE